MTSKDNLSNRFLIAMPTLLDATFNKSVVYIYEHSEAGAMGVLINKAMQINLGNIFEHLDIKADDPDVIKLPILMGGPVSQEHGFIIYPGASEKEKPEISASKEILEKIAHGQGPDTFVVTLGYAGWGRGQLESEIIRNDWLVAPADPKLIFSTPLNERWRQAAKLIGVDVDKLSSLTGRG